MSPSITASELRFHWTTALDDIGKEAWDACFASGSVYDSFELVQAVHHGRISGVEPNYLVGKHDGRIIFVLPCFRFPLSLSLLAPQSVQQWIERLRKVFPRAMYFDTFIAGSTVAICKDSLGIAQIPRGDRLAVLIRVKQQILERAQKLGSGLVVFKEITTDDLPLLQRALEPEFTIVESLPTMFLPVSDKGPPYIDRLRKKQRVLLRKRKRMFQEAGLRWEVATDFAPYAEAFVPLYLQVLARAETRLETLTADFFREVSNRLGDRSFALLCFKGTQLVAFEIFLQDEQWLQPMYLGMDYAFRDHAALYFNCLYRIIEECENRGYPVVQLGQSAYEAKGLLGAVMARLYVGLYHRNGLARLALGKLKSTLFPSIAPPRHEPFKDAGGLAILAARDVRFER
jgi:hypothetical protein